MSFYPVSGTNNFVSKIAFHLEKAFCVIKNYSTRSGVKFHNKWKKDPPNVSYICPLELPVAWIQVVSVHCTVSTICYCKGCGWCSNC